MSKHSPSFSDVKRLFALSGNCCAFPKCTAPMVIEETVVGEVCHIKGDKPSSARHDPAQSPEERHGFDNLILMCANHHTVIDDDPDSYTVERLLRLKSERPGRAQPVPEAEASRAAHFYLQSVSNTAQSGGLSAHTVTAQNITVQTNHRHGHLSARQTQAVESLWNAVCGLSQEFGQIVFLDSILLPQELQDHFSGAADIPFVAAADEYANPATSLEKLARAGASNAAKERPFVSPRLWTIFFVIQAIYGRTALLIGNSFKEERFRNWREDTGCEQLLSSVLPANAVAHVKGLSFNGLRTAIDMLEHQFLTEAGMNRIT